MSLLQHLVELGMEITLAPIPLPEAPTTLHNTDDHLAVITADQQKLLSAIGIHHIEDLAASEERNLRPIAYAQEMLQSKNITRPATFKAPENIQLIRPMMTFKQDDRD